MTGESTEKSFKPISEREKWLTAQIVDIAVKIHKTLGPGLLEQVYEKCFCYELKQRDISFVRQKCIAIMYDQLVIEEGFRVDILVDELIIIDVKAQKDYQRVWEVQLLSYLKLSRKRLGYILNFHVPLMKDGIKRMIFN